MIPVTTASSDILGSTPITTSEGPMLGCFLVALHSPNPHTTICSCHNSLSVCEGAISTQKHPAAIRPTSLNTGALANALSTSFSAAPNMYASIGRLMTDLSFGVRNNIQRGLLVRHGDRPVLPEKLERLEIPPA